jgi:GNAT superfamily N-acetyltransferase
MWHPEPVSMQAGVRLERFDPADDSRSTRDCHQIYLAGQPADDPHGPPMSPRYFAGWLRLGWTQDPSQAWLARDSEGEPCGWYLLGLPQRENQHLAEVMPVVHPSRRRARVGTALVRHAGARADDLGRTTLRAHAREGSAGAAFADALGARRGITDVRRMLDVTAVPAGRLAGLRRKTESATRRYSLLSWDGPVPEQHLAAVAAINATMADSPREAGHEPQRWDQERVRGDDRRVAAQGLRSHTVAARSLATGELAGLTQLTVDPADPAWGYQELTVVTGQHRGHRLGLLVKLGMLELLPEREPQLTCVITSNAEENLHMIAINDELGFAVLDRWPSWELEVRRALAAGRG